MKTTKKCGSKDNENVNQTFSLTFRGILSLLLQQVHLLQASSCAKQGKDEVEQIL